VFRSCQTRGFRDRHERLQESLNKAGSKGCKDCLAPHTKVQLTNPTTPTFLNCDMLRAPRLACIAADRQCFLRDGENMVDCCSRFVKAVLCWNGARTEEEPDSQRKNHPLLTKRRSEFYEFSLLFNEHLLQYIDVMSLG
jgi:hypothetical protein